MSDKNIPRALQVTETDGDSVVTAVEEILSGSGGKVLTSISTSSSSGPSSGSSASASSGSSASSSTGSSSSSSSSSSGTATGGGDAYGEETSPYESYDGGYGNYETYYDESTAVPDGDDTRRVTITSVGTGGELDLGAVGKVDLGAGGVIEKSVITTGTGAATTINATSVGSL